jgi:AraC-like DNA-binding protein
MCTPLYFLRMSNADAVFQKAGPTYRVRLRGSETGWHINPLPCILVGRDTAVSVRAASEVIEGEAVFVDAQTPHFVDFSGGTADIIYLEHASAFALPTLRLEAPACRHLMDEEVDWSDERAGTLLDIMSLSACRPDPIIDRVVRQIEGDPMARFSAFDAVRLTGLERTGLLRRFKQQTGMTFRGYKTWAALRSAGARLVAGEQIGFVGLDSGFSDAAHFSRCFRSAFGLTPSQAREAVTIARLR